MYLFCPKCHAQHPSAGRCPKCSSRLLSPGEAADALSISVAPPPDPPASTYAGRLGVGCVVALGLHLALHEWTTAILGESGNSSDPVGFVVGFLLRLFTACVGAMLTGGGRSMNFSGGAGVGAVCGLAWLLVDSYPRVVVDPLRGGLVGVLTVISGLVALVAGHIWPAPIVVPDAPSPRESSLLSLAPTSGHRKSGRPTSWTQIVFATMLAVGGVAAAESLRTNLKAFAPGLIHFGGPSAAPGIDFQISLLVVILASAISGAGTGAGFRHGLIAGIFSALGVVALRNLSSEGTLPGLDWVVEASCSPDAPPTTIEMILGLQVLLAMTVGGWLGGQLFPPLRKARRRLSY